MNSTIKPFDLLPNRSSWFLIPTHSINKLKISNQHSSTCSNIELLPIINKLSISNNETSISSLWTNLIQRNWTPVGSWKPSYDLTITCFVWQIFPKYQAFDTNSNSIRRLSPISIFRFLYQSIMTFRFDLMERTSLLSVMMRNGRIVY